jgi:hypothetical protein
MVYRVSTVGSYSAILANLMTAQERQTALQPRRMART